jgi:hypothetical protein
MTVASQTIEYFEMPELPGQRYFTCTRLCATLSTTSCAERWELAANAQPGDVRLMQCKNCPIGGVHAGKASSNYSRFHGQLICARCHMGATRLIGKNLCVSCYNRQREQIIGKNGKGSVPVKLAPLHRRSISYRAGDELKAKTIDRSVDTTELIVATLRDEERAVQFTWSAPAKVRMLLQEKGSPND